MTTTNDDDLADRLHAALPTILKAGEELEALGYTPAEIGDVFLLGATMIGRTLVGPVRSAKVLNDLARKILEGDAKSTAH